MNIVRQMSKLKLPTLLAITDNPAVRFWIKKHLDEEFFIIDASKKHAALTVAHTTAFDFVIVDSEFEDCNAIDLARELNQILKTLTPILLITGRLKKSYLDAAKEAGVTDFLSNQLDPEELQTRIATIRKGHSLREKTQFASSALSQQKRDRSGTYLKNRVLVQSQALKILKEAKKEGVPITALILQIDHFDELQTRFENLIAEKILIPLADLISRLLKKTDHLIPSTEGRFVILMTSATVENGRALAEKMKKEIHTQISIPNESGPLHLTASIVVSSLEGTETDFNRMVDSSVKSLKKAQDLIISIDTESP